MVLSARAAERGEFEFDVCKLKLGSGGSGTVFLAQHYITRELVAVKRLFPRHATECGRGLLRYASQNDPHHHHHHHPRRTPAAFCVTTPVTARTATPTFKGYGGSGDEEAYDASLLRDVNYHRGGSRSSSTVSSYTSRSNEDDMHDDIDLTLEEQEDEETKEAEEGHLICDDEEERESSSSKQGRFPSAARLPCESMILHYLGPHHHIVKFLGSYTTSKRVTFFAMELMDSDVGRELWAANTAFMNEDIARPLLHSVVSAIAHLHKRGIAHRDVKPSNILLRRVDAAKLVVNTAAQATTNITTPRTEPYKRHMERQSQNLSLCETEHVKAALGDFGAAHFMHEGSNVWGGRGTLYYKSPEQLMGRAEDYFACDMWALGCTLFELSTGSVAFCGSSDLQVLHQIYAKLGTNFHSYPDVTRTATLFNSLSAPSPALLDLLNGLLALDPRKRLTAGETMKHAFFDPIRQKYGVDSDNTEVTFPLRPRYRRPVDAARYTFRPVCNTPAKRSRAAVGGGSSHVRRDANRSDVNLSCSVRRCSVWSSSFSAGSSPRGASTCMKSHHESVDVSRRRGGESGACSIGRLLSLSLCTPKVGGVNAQGKDDNPRTVHPSISPVALCFSPATSVKCHGCSLSMTNATAAAAVATAVASQGNKLRWTPSSNVTLGNTRTNLLFERAPVGRGACAGMGGSSLTGPRVLFDDDSHSCHHDADSPLVRKTLFGSPQRPLIYRLNDSADNAETSVMPLDEP
ncbi:protein kinase [Trypanosoma rangeli SC58]|uniref:Protein kinase n=1 Tax=Trypanosoma rangeli SC58 TaxID=429131 RepID=A0A061J070_TRYRA|nr:protein kinase [Trypanosoma rangeli SC58]